MIRLSEERRRKKEEKWRSGTGEDGAAVRRWEMKNGDLVSMTLNDDIGSMEAVLSTGGLDLTLFGIWLGNELLLLLACS
ncbi:hypothetical protein LguiB_009381 [Lonicera macranthoides]